MNFFEHQARAKSMTGRLIFLFTAAVFATVGSVVFLGHSITVTSLADQARFDRLFHRETSPFLQVRVDLAIALVTLIIIASGALIRWLSLRGKGESVALMLGGERLSPDSRDPDERRLLNVVEEMSIASGITVPPVFVLRRESSINAFAAGDEPSQAVIGVTQGCLKKLNRDELQGVIAHEFSHVFNGDMRLNLRLISLLGGILGLSVLGRVIIRATSEIFSEVRNSKDIRFLAFPVVFILIGLSLVVLGSIGVFFGALIKAAVSRQREFLADASAVQYTRNPFGIGGALLKIKNDDQRSAIANPHAMEAGHLFFGSVSRLEKLFSEHPPLEQRIDRIAPALLWKKAKGERKGDQESHDATASQATSADGAAPAAVHVLSPFCLATKGPIAENVVNSIGHVTITQVRAAQEAIAKIPSSAHKALLTAEGAKAAIVHLLLLKTDGVYKEQREQIVQCFGVELVDRAEKLGVVIGDGGRESRFTILELAVQGLRLLNEEEKDAFIACFRRTIEDSREFEAFEFALYKIVSRQLKRARRGVSEPRASLERVKGELSLVFSALAHAGTSSKRDATGAFSNGARHVWRSGLALQFHPRESMSVTQLDVALDRLAGLIPRDKELLLKGLAVVVLDDEIVRHEEFELLRAYCCVLECPLPPSIEARSSFQAMPRARRL